MTRPYSLFKKSNGYYYVQFLLADGSRSQNKSTGTKDRKEAESIAMRWAVLGDIPERINSKAEKAKSQSVDRISFFNSMSTYDFSPEEIDKMISIMQKRGFILSAVKPNSKQSIPIEEFLDEFWNYEKSPYVQELALEGKILSRSHVKNERSRVENYWIPKLKGKCIGSITNDMLKDIVSDKKIQKLAGKTINGIVESITTPLKWAMKNQYIENITFYGLKRRNTKSEERAILTMEEADKVMNIGWENDKAKLANKLAMQTGMRASEIRGLRICDIHAEGIIVDHAWDRYARANKCCKNGEARQIPIPISKELREELLFLGKLNPFCETDKAYIFCSDKCNSPMDNSGWVKYLRRALEKIGYENPKDIVFHSWRHFFCSRMLDVIPDKRIVMALSGHKTSAMLDHYAKHLEDEKTLEIVRQAMKELFGDNEQDSVDNAAKQAFKDKISA